MPLVLDCSLLLQVSQMLSAVTQAMPKLRGRRGSPCALQFWLGWDPDGLQPFQNSSCREQTAEVRGMAYGILLDVLQHGTGICWSSEYRIPEPQCFPGSYSTGLELLFCTTWVDLGHSVPQNTLLLVLMLVGCEVSAAVSSLCASEGMGCNSPASPEQHHSTMCGQASVCIS